MFTVIISESGGAERREYFAKGEVSIGRVQGNDLMLPKGNVSKHHARILFRDGRFIVSDLKSTNGTYVNGRKIAQATPVRETDKIFIGDFVLRLEPGASDQPVPVHVDAVAVAPMRGPIGSNPQLSPMPMQAGAQAAPQVPMGVPQAVAQNPAAPAQRPSRPVQEARPPSRPPVPPPGLPQRQQTMALPGARPQVAAGPNFGGTPAAPGVAPLVSPPQMASANAAVAPSVPQVPVVAPAPHPVPLPAAVPPPAPVRPAPVATAPPPAPARPPSVRDGAATAARRLALVTLVDRVSDVVNLAPLASNAVVDEKMASILDRAVREQANAMREEGEVPDGVEIELVSRDALKELVALGPLSALLEDESITEVHAVRFDSLLVFRAKQSAYAEVAFSGNAALERAIRRLAVESGDGISPSESLVTRRLPNGVAMTAILPPYAPHAVLTLKRAKRQESSLEEAVRGGVLGRSVATFLEHCVVSRANVLVMSSSASSATTFLSALVATAPPAERGALIQESEDVGVPGAHIISLNIPRPGEAAQLLRAATLTGALRTFVAPTSTSALHAVIDTILSGAQGVVAATVGPSLQLGLGRLAGQVVFARPGTSFEMGRELLHESFDVFVEISHGEGGRTRVSRIAESTSGEGTSTLRDIFAVEGSGDCVATGLTPRVVALFGAAGLRVDPGLFRKAPR